jgi:hypothetical protein
MPVVCVYACCTVTVSVTVKPGPSSEGKRQYNVGYRTDDGNDVLESFAVCFSFGIVVRVICFVLLGLVWFGLVWVGSYLTV